MGEQNQESRRQQEDRRRKPTNPLSRASIFGSRKEYRRDADRRGQPYVDRYGYEATLLFLFVLILSLADAFFTLRLLDSGGEELNPVMDFFLQFGPVPFLVAKYLMTGICLIFIVMHKEFYLWRGRVRVKYVMHLFLLAYLVLIVWEFILLGRIT